MIPPTAHRSGRWWFFRILRGAAFVYVIYALALFLMQRALIFPTWLIPTTPRPALPPTAEVWTRDLGSGQSVEAFFLPGKGASTTAPGPAVLFFHGNGERIDDWVAPLEPYVERGVTVLLVEYRGYGRSGGSPSKAGMVEDALSFEQRLAQDSRIDRSRLIIHGRSIGGGVACAVAEKIHPAALILQSAFTRLGDLAHRRGLPGFLVRDPFDNVAAVQHLGVPTFIVHGRSDNVIPFELGRELAEAIPGARFEALECKHNDCPPDWASYMGEVLAFLENNHVVPPLAVPRGGG